MIQVFCNKRGSGKTKALINMANSRILTAKGDVVYVNYNQRPMLELDRRIRFISTEDYNLKDYNSFYGFLCGMLSEDYDIETIYVDGLSNIISGDIRDAAHLFLSLEKLSQKNGLDVYINISQDSKELPEYIKKYVA